MQLRRAVLTLLYGSVHQEAANALLLSDTDYCKNLEKADGSQGISVDPLVLPSSGADSSVYSWCVPHASGRITAGPLASVGRRVGMACSPRDPGAQQGQCMLCLPAAFDESAQTWPLYKFLFRRHHKSALAGQVKTGAESAAGQVAPARVLWLALLRHDASSRRRWAHRLQRQGVLLSVLQAGLQGGHSSRATAWR